MKALQDLIHENLAALTPAEKRVARAILGDYPTLALRSASVIAREADTSQATVVRFAAKIGIEGLPELRALVRGEVRDAAESPFARYRTPDGGTTPSVAAGQSVLALVAEAVNRIQPAQIDEATRLVLEARQVWLAGGRFSQGLAQTLFAHLDVIRPRVRFLGLSPTPVPDQVAHAGRDELAIIVDFKRYDPTAEFIARHFSRARGKVIVITDPLLTPAAQHSDLTFVVPVEGFGLVDSYTGALAVIDVLIANLVASNAESVSDRSAAIERARREAASISAEYPDDYDDLGR